MKKTTGINPRLSVARIISILMMGLCLLFLTGVNFFVYPPSHPSYSNCQNLPTNGNEEESPAPVEEKSSSKTGLTVQEEYIHELHTLELSAFIVLSKHRIPAVERLQIVHFERDSPPPKA